jgi:UDP-N-acetylmuramyl pentapeptide phosphotransferase/UDP-N-acetylglucosamine-1-phosphate transferase
MISATQLFAASATALTLAACLLYRALWVRRFGPERTPTGFGVLLPPVLFAGAVIEDGPWQVEAALGTVTVAAALYWLDDAVELSARIRLLISFATGAAIGAIFLAASSDPGLLELVLVCTAAGLLHVVSTNIVNFYDGADLNLATFIALTAGFLLTHAQSDAVWLFVAVGCFAFVLPFSVLNSRPRTIYLGDSGSFAFASLLTILAVAFFVNRAAISPKVAIPAALPAFDVLYVFTVRLAEKHDLLTRNHLHLYQRLQARYTGFGYLVPQVANAALCLAAVFVLEQGGMAELAAVIIGSAVVTVPLYFVCRRLFVRDGVSVVPESNG